MLKLLTKATVSICLTPVSLVADILTLPSSAYNNNAPFGKTASLLNNSAQCVNAALSPTQGKL